jgi:PAS domain S-box-containing protein
VIPVPSSRGDTDDSRDLEAVGLPADFGRAALDSLSEAVVVIDRGSTVLYFSPAATALFGYTAAETIGRNINMIMPARESAEHDLYVRRYIETAQPRIIGRTREVTGLTKDGRLIPIDLRVVPIRLGDQDCFIGSMRDVSERKTREAALQSLSDRLGNQLGILDAILSNIEEGVCLFDTAGKLVCCNRRYLALLDLPDNVIAVGMTLEEMIDLIVGLGLIRADEAASFKQRRLALLQSEHGDRLTVHLASGRTLRVLHRKMPDGRSIATYRDVTATESAAAELRHAIQRAEDASRSKSNFLANMSHELRTPLNGILGITEALKLGYFGTLTAQQAVYLDDVHSAGQHLLRIINGILDLARIEAGRFDLMEVTVRADELVEAAVQLVASLAREAGLSIARAGPVPGPLLKIDRQAMVQVLVNLLSNAIKFTPRGHRVAISWHGGAEGVSFEIADEGIGMKREEIELALTPFGQAESSRTKRHEGTGLGLPLAQHMVSLHGGRLTVQSEANKGTIVTVLLPHSRVADAPPATWRARKAAKAG